MEVKELQEKANEIVLKIDEKIGIEHDKETTLMHLVEEVGEVSRQILNPKLRNEKTDIKNLSEEIADVVLLISKLAYDYGIDLETAVKTKIKKLKQRHSLK